jgi:protein-tyrosine-phosphatase
MQFLFVDTGNIGRSQIAAAFMRSLASKDISVISAGTNVGQKEGESLHKFVIEVLKEKRIDLSFAKRTQLTDSMLTESDHVIGIFEPSEVPEELRTLDKFETWNIDNPKDTTLEFHRVVRDQVEKEVVELIERTNAK